MALAVSCPLRAATLTVRITDDQRITTVGALQRWDADGNARREVDPKAKIDQPHLDARARRAGPGRWVFEDLKPGQYDLVILRSDRVRIEGFNYPPVLEFDPFFPPDATTKPETRQFITEDIQKSRHYENKVRLLALGGDEKAIRALVMLLRDLPTSYTPGMGTLRFEISQYTWNYGAWVKERRTRVLHRLLIPVAEVRRWTWVWEPKLGAVSLGTESLTLEYRLPTGNALEQMPGLHPY